MLPFQFAQGTTASGAATAVGEALRWTDKVWNKIADPDMWLNIMFKFQSGSSLFLSSPVLSLR